MEVFFNNASLADVRNAIRELGVGETQDIYTLCPSQTLAEPFIDMATDTIRFLSPNTQWNLIEFGGTLLGAVYPLEQALINLSSPFYLLTTEVRVKSTLDRTLDVAVKATMVDLAEHIRLQINSGRRIARALEKRFPY